MNQLYYFNKSGNNFDFVRASAAVGVLITHCFDLSDKASLEPLRMLNANSLSFYAVRILFIVSGFLIAQSARNSTSSVTFFSKRALRIFPALIVTVFLSIFLLGPVVTTFSLPTYFRRVETYRYFSNILLYCNQQELPGVFGVVNHSSIVNGSLWTLTYEFTFYIGLYIIFKLGFFERRFLLFISLALVILAEYYLTGDPIL